MVGNEYECLKIAAQVVEIQGQNRRDTSAVSADGHQYVAWHQYLTAILVTGEGARHPLSETPFYPIRRSPSFRSELTF